MSPSTDARFIGLSDNGACLNFGWRGYFQAHGIPAYGQWSGKIKTLSHIVDICTPFYKLQARTRYGNYVPLFVLGTEDIGYKKGAPAEVLDAIAKMFRVPPNLLSNPEGEIDLLIGLKSGQLLLREVYQVNGKDLMKSHFSKDLQLCSSLLTNLLVCKGAVGGQRFGGGNSI